MRILAVDDEKLPPEALADAIEKAEPAAEIFCFRSGKAALTFAAQTPCEVAFLDIHMRDMDGFLLAKELKRIDPTVNIIFATSCSEYALVALELHCSGYLMKPITPEKVRRELGDLRYPIRQKGQQRVYFQAFGNFEVFVDGIPVKFKYEKTRELLAFPVDRGTLCTNGEIMAALWDKTISRSYLRMLRKDLTDTFQKAGCGDVIMQKRGSLAIVPERVSCDYYDWARGEPQACNAYRGEYMTQYSWSEITHGTLEALGEKSKGFLTKIRQETL